MLTVDCRSGEDEVVDESSMKLPAVVGLSLTFLWTVGILASVNAAGGQRLSISLISISTAGS